MANAPHEPFTVVGVGASAGGLDAFTQLLQALPADTGMAFVLVQHLAPGHVSSLAEILQRATRMPVSEVKDEPHIEANRVYVIPPGKSMVVSAGRLQLRPREGKLVHRPVDIFFESLAQDQGHQSIGVILSGTANDGTLGLQEIKAAGGITLAQDHTAQHEGMPQSAIAAGCVDFVLPPGEIAAELARIARHPYVARKRVAQPQTTADERSLERIVQLLEAATNVDFGHYKAGTLYRRITRRMVLQRLNGLAEYARFIAETPGEAEALFQDLLIGVTSFFRNPEMFEALKQQVLPKLIAGRSRHDPLRVWVLGCSTGEEAYSFAMAISEFLAEKSMQVPLQIFATDLNAASIERARAGVYPKAIAQDVTPARLRSFFVEIDGSLRISKAIREQCVFARHNVLTDPPFSHMDIISCRNLLIYVEPVLQRRMLPMLHYALKPNGFLVLGGSENVGGYRELFEPLEGRLKIFAKKPAPSGPAPVHYGPLTHTARPTAAAPARETPLAAAEFVKEAERVLLARFAPPGVLLNGELEILQFRGDTGPYLSPAPGKASLNVLKMAREGLLVGLRAALHKAKREEKAVREEGLRVRGNGGFRTVSLDVIPVRVGPGPQSGFLVLFSEAVAAAKRDRAKKRPDDEMTEDERTRLAQELAATREYLQSVIEEQEAANEELQSANEEAQSANEELQSINEELETSKEEIQSGNEELATVNDELANRNEELGRVNDDLVNLLGSIETAIVIVGRDLRIRRFTPMAQRLFNLIPGDVGRPISDIQLGLALPDLEQILEDVIGTLAVRELEVQDRQKRWHALRMRPYRTLENKIDGAVLMLLDIDDLKRARELAYAVAGNVEQPMLVLDSSLRVKSATQSYYAKFGGTPLEIEGKPLREINAGRWDVAALQQALGEVIASNHGFDNLPVGAGEGPGRRAYLVSATQMTRHEGEPPYLLLGIQDEKDRTRLAGAVRQIERMDQAERAKDAFLAMVAHELRNPLAALNSGAALLVDPRVDEAVRKRTGAAITRQVALLTRMVDDLLDSARLAYGKIGLQIREQPLQPILEESLQAVRPVIQARRQELSVKACDEELYVKADAVRLQQVFINLLQNASKFTPAEGRIGVSVDFAARQEPPWGTALVRVSDSGAGMSRETLGQAFDLFVQAEQGIERPMGGLGLGLTIAQHLTELHGGSMEAHSEGLGKGSDFTIRLPARRSSGIHLPGDVAVPVETSAPPARRIIIVDDNVDAAEMLAASLRLSGHLVETVHHPLEAIEFAASFRPDAMLVDIGLPEIDGHELARRLREHPATRNITLVALTGYGTERDRSQSEAAGFDYHLIKPVDMNALERVLSPPPPRKGRPG